MRRAVVRENLSIAFGERDGRLERATYRHFASAAVDLAWFGRLFDPEESFRFEGGALEHYLETKPHGAIFASGHFGNWELFGAALRRKGIPLVSVARPVDKGWLARLAGRFRADHGSEFIPKTNALPLALKAVRAGKCVAFLVDQSAGRHGIPATFFGRTAHTFTAPAALALKLKVPLYAGYSTRLGDGISYRSFAQLVEVGDDDVSGLTQRLNDLLEGFVRACPEQWWWFHRRFKLLRTERAGKRVSPAGLPLE